MTRAEYLDTIDTSKQCCICEELVDLDKALYLTGPATMPEFKDRGLLICPACYKREIASAIHV